MFARSRQCFLGLLNQSCSRAASSCNAKSYKEIPSPPGLPIIGHTHKLMDIEYLNDISSHYGQMQKECGDIIRLNIIGHSPFVMLFNPEDIQTVYKNDGKYPHSPGFDPLVYYRKNIRPDLYPKTGGLIGEHYEGWYEVRTQVQQDLLRPQSAMYYIDDLQDISQDLINVLASNLDQNQTSPDNTLELIHLWAFESISSVFLNAKLHSLDKNPPEDSKRMTESMNSLMALLVKVLFEPPLWKVFPNAVPWFRKFDNALETLHKISSEKVEIAAKEILANKKGKDYELPQEKSVLEKLMDKSKDEDLTIAKVMASDGMMAGIDTTGNTAAFLLYNLAKYPEKQEILRQEIETITGMDPKQKITEKQINRMTYIKACLQESMRVTPTVFGLSRVSQVPMVLSGYEVPKNAFLMMCFQCMGMDPRNFQDPDSFVPERWLRGHDLHHKAHPFAFLQFSHGARMCVGRRFATLELYLLVIKMLQHFSLSYEEVEPIKVVNSFVNRPSKPIKLKTAVEFPL